MNDITPNESRQPPTEATAREVVRRIEKLAVTQGHRGLVLEQIEGLAAGYRLWVREWDAESEANKLIVLFEGYLYGDKSVSESLIVAAIQKFRTKQEIELNPEWNHG